MTCLSLEQLKSESLLVNQLISLTLSSCPEVNCECKSLLTTLYNKMVPLTVPNANSSKSNTSCDMSEDIFRFLFFVGEPFVIRENHFN